MFREGLRYPVAGRPGYGTILGGTALYLVAFLFFVGGTRRLILYLGVFLVLSLLWGYQLEVARQVVVDPEPPAPRIGKLGERVRDGVRGTVVIGTFVAPGMAFFAVGNMLRRSVPIVSALAFISAVGLLLIAAYVLPAALTVLAITDRVRTALQPNHLLDIVDTEDYAVAWVIGTGMRISALVLVVLVVGVILWFYVEIASTYVYAVGVSQLNSINAGPGTESGTNAA